MRRSAESVRGLSRCSSPRMISLLLLCLWDVGRVEGRIGWDRGSARSAC